MEAQFPEQMKSELIVSFSVINFTMTKKNL